MEQSYLLVVRTFPLYPLYNMYLISVITIKIQLNNLIKTFKTLSN